MTAAQPDPGSGDIHDSLRQSEERFRLALDALRESEDRFRQLADNLPYGFIYQITQNASGSLRFSYVSAGVEALFGIKAEDAVRDPALLYGMVLAEDLPKLRAREEECYRERKPFDFQFRVRLGGAPAPGDPVSLRWLHCRSAPRPTQDGWLVWDGIAIDITERKQYEQALKESERRFARFMQHLPGLAWIKDLAGRYVYGNDAAVKAFGLSRTELQGKTDHDIFPPATAEQFSANDREALASGSGVQVVETLKHEDGLIHHSLVSKFPIPGPDGVPALVGGMAIDITDRLRAENALREADRLKDEFLAMLAHELRNPLAPIRNALHILKQPDADDALYERARDMAERQVLHMVRLLDDLLDVSRFSRGRIELRKEIVDLVAVAQRTIETQRPALEEKGQHLEVSLPSEPVWVDGDPTRLEQILTNLIGNAVRYTAAGGRIQVSGQRENGQALLQVRDTGIGIAPEMLPRVFDLFVQGERGLDRSEGGLGIGLTLVKRLVELHGGQVEVRSAGLGQGSEFSVRLPEV